MPGTNERLPDAQIARTVVELAARHLVEVRIANRGLDGRRLKELGDAEAQKSIAATLAMLAPADSVLSEEAADSDARINAARVWIIDPLDGTREFSEGRDDWAVHAALVIGRTLAVGAVALGGPDRVLVSNAVTRPAPSDAGPIRIAVSRTRPPAIVEHVAARLKADLVPMGSAGVKISSVVAGETDAYIHGGGQYEWDSAAPIAVARAAGLHTSRLDGSDLTYNQPNPYLPDLVVCRPELKNSIMRTIADALAAQAE